MQSSEVAVQGHLFGGPTEATGRELKEAALDRGLPVRLRFRGRIVPDRVARDACQLHDDFCRISTVRLQRFLPDGSASESLKRIVGALSTHSDVTYDRWASVLQQVLANPWWGDGKPSVGVVFGPGVVEQNLDDPGRGRSRTPAELREREKQERTAKRMAVARGLA